MLPRISARNILRLCLAAGFLWLAGAPAAPAAVRADAGLPELAALKDGDVIFQVSPSPQSLALQLATGSPYTHCGILFRQQDGWKVFEASGTVVWTPLENWILRGLDRHYLILRLKDVSALTPEILASMRLNSSLYAGKAYDLLFQWSDDKMYCSELVWKIYQRYAGLELGPLRRFSDYDLDHREVQEIIHRRYGTRLPPEEKVVAPSDLIDCGLLETVAQNGSPPQAVSRQRP
jgi:hypothetical protein